MSVCVNIRTSKEIEPNEIFDGLVGKGEKIIITSDEFPSLQLGTYHEALRGIEINKEEGSYEVRICTFASLSDYKLFTSTIVLLRDMTGGSVYEEDDDDCLIEDPAEYYNEDWAIQDVIGAFSTLTALIRKKGLEITLFGLFANICIGPKLLDDFHIPLDEEFIDDGDIFELQDYLISIQWHLSDKEDTSTRMLLPDPNDDSRKLSISAIMISESEVKSFDYISSAEIFGIFDIDSHDNVLIPMRQLWKILPKGVFRSLDELQYERIEELSAEQVRDMMEMAKRFQPADIHYKPTKPGQGYDDRQKTFILMWNPAISSVTLEDHNNNVSSMLSEFFNWSVWEYDKAQIGDRFFLVRVGEGKTGVVMSGTFSSMPYEADDWSGKGRQTFYMDMEPNVILNPEEAPIVSTEDLQKAIPSFDWTGGHSGRALNDEEAKAIEDLWSQFIESNEENFNGDTMNKVD